MRLYLLPLSTRRTLLYAQRLNIATTDKNQNIIDKAVSFAARKWSEFEKKESGWQRKVVDYGNQAFRRIPYEEWGLKSVPPLSTRRRADELEGKEKIELVYPSRTISAARAQSILRVLATEREPLHKKRMMLSFAAMPLTIPVAVIPVIPNLPFFYLAYRAWSHWRAISGGRHVQWLLENKLILDAPSTTLDHLYNKDGPKVDDSPEAKEQLLLTQKQVQNFSDTLGMPELEIELERAIWQVEQAVEKEHNEAAGGEKKASSSSSEETTDEKEKKKEKGD